MCFLAKRLSIKIGLANTKEEGALCYVSRYEMCEARHTMHESSITI